MPSLMHLKPVRASSKLHAGETLSKTIQTKYIQAPSYFLLGTSVKQWKHLLQDGLEVLKHSADLYLPSKALTLAHLSQ